MHKNTERRTDTYAGTHTKTEKQIHTHIKWNKHTHTYRNTQNLLDEKALNYQKNHIPLLRLRYLTISLALLTPVYRGIFPPTRAKSFDVTYGTESGSLTNGNRKPFKSITTNQSH